MSCPGCNEAALEACMQSSWGWLRNQSLQHSTRSSFLWHYHYDPHPQNHRLHPSLKKLHEDAIKFLKYNKQKKSSRETAWIKGRHLMFYLLLTAKPHHHQDDLPRILSHHIPITRKVRHQRSKWYEVSN